MADSAPKKKQKATKMSLQEFITPTSSSNSWADQADEAPSRYDDEPFDSRQSPPPRRDEPAPADDRYDDRRGGGDRYEERRGGDRYDDRRGGGGDRYGERRGDRYDDRRGGGGDRCGERRGDRYGDREERRERPVNREQRPVPDKPPFIAFLGNLAYDLSEQDIGDFFTEGPCNVKSVRILMDAYTQRPKGFGYIEFEDKESLERALEANGMDLARRALRVDVAEEKQHSNEGPSRADMVDRWERGKKIQRQDDDRRGGDRYGERRGGGGDRYDDRRGGGERYGERRDRPRERPRLNLQPRTGEAPRIPPPAEGARSSSIFGQAKPRDEDAILRKKEEERKKREAERKAKEEAEQKSKPPAEKKSFERRREATKKSSTAAAVPAAQERDAAAPAAKKPAAVPEKKAEPEPRKETNIYAALANAKQ